jgi:hypothetical protein
VPQTGKTQVALEYTHRFAAHYDVVWWLDCTGDNDLAAQLAELAAQLSARDAGDGWPSSERRLFVFDGVERLAEVTATIWPCTGRRLVTSRGGGHWPTGQVVTLTRLTRVESALLVTTVAPMINSDLAEEFAEILDDRPALLAEVSEYLLRDDVSSPELCLRLLKMPVDTRPLPHARQDGRLSTAELNQFVDALLQVAPIGEQATYRLWIQRIEAAHGHLGLPDSAYAKTRLANLVERCARHPNRDLIQSMMDELAVLADGDPALPLVRDLVADYLDPGTARQRLDQPG